METAVFSAEPESPLTTLPGRPSLFPSCCVVNATRPCFRCFPGGVGVTVVNRAPFPVDRCFFPVWPFHRIGRCFLVSNPVFTGFGLVTTVSEYRGTVLSMCGSGQHRVCGVFRFRVNVTDLRSFRQLGAFDRLAVNSWLCCCQYGAYWAAFPCRVRGPRLGLARSVSGPSCSVVLLFSTPGNATRRRSSPLSGVRLSDRPRPTARAP